MKHSEIESVLIIDDSRLSRSSMTHLIKERLPSWITHEAENAEIALTMEQSKTYDLFIVDINMPGMSGLELAPLIKAQTPNGNIVFLTANIQETIKKQVQALGAGFLNKPIKENTIDQLIDTLDKYLVSTINHSQTS